MPAAVRRALEEHAQAEAPNEACGLIAFRDGVNVTLGLPFVRTSPDHGTAYDIAWKDKADPASMEAALKLAVQLVVRPSSRKRGSMIPD